MSFLTQDQKQVERLMIAWVLVWRQDESRVPLSIRMDVSYLHEELKKLGL